MISASLGCSPETHFTVIKWSEKRGTREVIEFPNVVLDVGWEHYMDLWTSTQQVPLFLYLGTGTTEPTRLDIGLEDISTTLGANLVASTSYGGRTKNGNIYAFGRQIYNYGEGAAAGTWTELGLGFWDGIGGAPSARAGINTYTFPYNRSLFRKAPEIDRGTVTAATATSLTDSSRTWDAGFWATDYTVYIVSGTGAGQSREVVSSTADTLTVANWDVIPDATSVYEIRGTPVSVTVLADEFLTVVAELRMFFDISGLSGSFDYDGQTINWVGRLDTQYPSQVSTSFAFWLPHKGLPRGVSFRNSPPSPGNANFPNVFGESIVDVPSRSVIRTFNMTPQTGSMSILDIGLVAAGSADTLIHLDLDPPMFLPAETRLQGGVQFSIHRAD